MLYRIVSRFGELGVQISQGKLHFDPYLLKEVEFLTVPGTFYYTTVSKEKRVIKTLSTSRLMVPAPVFLLRPVVAIMESTLPGSPVSGSLLDLLAVPNTVPNNALVEEFGMDPIPFKGQHIT